MEQDSEPRGTYVITSVIPGGHARRDFFPSCTEAMAEQEVRERVEASKFWNSDAVHSFERVV